MNSADLSRILDSAYETYQQRLLKVPSDVKFISNYSTMVQAYAKLRCAEVYEKNWQIFLKYFIH